jgi:hypothetical protein
MALCEHHLMQCEAALEQPPVLASFMNSELALRVARRDGKPAGHDCSQMAQETGIAWWTFLPSASNKTDMYHAFSRCLCVCRDIFRPLASTKRVAPPQEQPSALSIGNGFLASIPLRPSFA